jgi:hypothetical protein
MRSFQRQAGLAGPARTSQRQQSHQWSTQPLADVVQLAIASDQQSWLRRQVRVAWPFGRQQPRPGSTRQRAR